MYIIQIILLRAMKVQIQQRIRGWGGWGGARPPWPLPCLAKIGQKKDGREMQRLIFYVSWHPSPKFLDPLLRFYQIQIQNSVISPLYTRFDSKQVRATIVCMRTQHYHSRAQKGKMHTQMSIYIYWLKQLTMQLHYLPITNVMIVPITVNTFSQKKTWAFGGGKCL